MNTSKLLTSSILTVALLATGPLAIAGKKKTEQKPQSVASVPVSRIDHSEIDTSKLVWPQPPDVARIRFLSEYFGEAVTPKEKQQEVASKPKKKQGWMDRLAGVQVSEAADLKRTQFLKPYGVAVDSKGRVYVADTSAGAIFILDLEKKTTSLLRNGHEAKFQTIIGLAIDDADRLFVSDTGFHRITVFDAKGTVETTFGENTLQNPGGMAIDNENRWLYVVDTTQEKVFVFDADTFKLLRTIGGPAPTPGAEDEGTFAKPTNVAVDGDGNIYVADTINDRIQEFDPDGKFIRMFGKPGDGPGDFGRPKGIAVDADGNIWVTDALLGRVQVFDKDTKLLGVFGMLGTLPGQFNTPTGITVDKNNRVIISDQLPGRVQIFRYVTNDEAAALKKSKGVATSAKTEGTR